MRIAFPLYNEFEKIMTDGFHGSQYVGLYNLSNNEIEQLSISDLEIQFSKTDLTSIFTELGVQVVICKKIHPLALKIFNENNITVYKSESDQLTSNIDLLKKGSLQKYQTNMTQLKSCNSSCSSCSSTSCN